MTADIKTGAARVPTVPDEISNAVLAQSIQHLGGGLLELKGLVTGLSQQINAMQMEKVGTHAVLDGRITAAHVRLDQQAAEVAALKETQKKTAEALPQLLTAYRIMVFVGGALGISIVGLIWSLIIGQVRLVIP